MNRLPSDLIRCLCDHISAKTLYALVFIRKRLAIIIIEERFRQRCFRRLLYTTTEYVYTPRGHYLFDNIISRTPDGKRNGKTIGVNGDYIYEISEYKNDELHGVFEQWSEDNMMPLHSGYYQNGLKEGLHRTWWHTEDISNLAPMKFVTYEADKSINSTYYAHDGTNLGAY